MVKKTKGFIKCIREGCGKVKRYTRARFPVDIFNNKGEFKGRICFDCVHQERTVITKGWGHVDRGKVGKAGRRKRKRKKGIVNAEEIEVKDIREFFVKEEV